MLKSLSYLSLNCRTLLNHRDVWRMPALSFTTLRDRVADRPCGWVKAEEADKLLKKGSGRSYLWVNLLRGFAKKGKDSRKESVKKGKLEKPHVHLSDEELAEVIDFNKMKNQMEMTLEHLRKDFAEQLTLRTSVGNLDKLVVETPDGKFPLMQLGQVIQKNPQLMIINMTATPQYIPFVKIAILGSGVNVNPQQEGTTLFIPVPKITKEHREGLAKNAKGMCEKTKEKLRNIQNNFARDVKKAKDDHSEDLVFNVHETILVTTKKYIDEAEAILIAKQSELLGN